MLCLNEVIFLTKELYLDNNFTFVRRESISRRWATSFHWGRRDAYRWFTSTLKHRSSNKEQPSAQNKTYNFHKDIGNNLVSKLFKFDNFTKAVAIHLPFPRVYLLFYLPKIHIMLTCSLVHLRQVFELKFRRPRVYRYLI